MMMESEDRLSFYLREQDEQVHYTVCISLASVSLFASDSLRDCHFSFETLISMQKESVKVSLYLIPPL